jgi:hypothetical protein
MKNYFIVGIMAMFLTGCQSGCTSRYTGGTTKLPAPTDIHKPIGFGKSKTTKYLSYLNKDGVLMVKEYSDGGVFEATYEFTGAKFDTTTGEKKAK